MMKFTSITILLSVSYLNAAKGEHVMEPLIQDADMYLSMFDNYMTEYSKSYATEPMEMEKRFRAFKQNVQRIQEHNEKYKQGLTTFTLGLNDVADLTDDEYKQYLLGYRKSTSSTRAAETFTRTEADLPDAWDWREHDAVTPIKNQGMCGSCWAFSAVAAMEGAYAKTTHKLVSFSEQELVDCVNGGKDTCNRGGEMQDGFDEIISHHGGKVDPEEAYAYTGSSKGVCHADDSKAIGHFTSYVNVTSGDESAMQEAVATQNVLSVAIDASSFLFQLYRHGVFNWPLCKNGVNDLDHGVAVVGYGTKAGHDFWLVKNSWGKGWGMHGYIMMSRNKKNQCGIATDASYPIMKQ